MYYRSDIDGLRAIAILFVLFFHGGLSVFPSGFIGVDIFFVISGFLITGLIHDSLNNDRFSFIEFYNRRLWRLQPVFVCLVAVTALITLLFYLPEDLVAYFKSARKTSLFMANRYFEGVTSDYFASNNNQLPLLHTWSLSIEWQCYFILPLLIFALHRVLPKESIAKAIYLLTLFFLSLTLYYSFHHTSDIYYKLWSRVFEFLIGSCVALSSTRISVPKYGLEVVSLLALTALIYIATLHQVNVGFPNGYAFVLCSATALLIAVGKYPYQTLVTRLLSLKPVVFIGLISYSLYIWHWPVFALIRYLNIEETSKVLVAAFLVVFALGYLSWRFIEKPTRAFKTLHFRYGLVYLVILPITLVHLSSMMIKHHEGYPRRFAELAKIDAELTRFKKPQRALCMNEKENGLPADCMMGDKGSSQKTAFMIGDSYANHYWGFIDTLAQAAHVSVLSYTTPACLTLPGIQQNNWLHTVYKTCHKNIDRFYQMIKTNHYDFVILGQCWDGYEPQLIMAYNETAHSRIEKSLSQALQIITDAGSMPVLIKSHASLRDPYKCFFHHIKEHTPYDPKECTFNLSEANFKWQDALFARMKQKYPQLIIIDPKDAQCEQGICKVDIAGIPLFRDVDHFNDFGSYQLADIYLQHQKNPLIT